MHLPHLHRLVQSDPIVDIWHKQDLGTPIVFHQHVGGFFVVTYDSTSWNGRAIDLNPVDRKLLWPFTFFVGEWRA